MKSEMQWKKMLLILKMLKIINIQWIFIAIGLFLHGLLVTNADLQSGK